MNAVRHTLRQLTVAMVLGGLAQLGCVAQASQEKPVVSRIAPTGALPSSSSAEGLLRTRITQMLRAARDGQPNKVKDFMVKGDGHNQDRAEELALFYRPLSDQHTIEFLRIEGGLAYVLVSYPAQSSITGATVVFRKDTWWLWTDNDWYSYQPQTSMPGINPNVTEREEYVSLILDNQQCACAQEERQEVESLTTSLLEAVGMGRLPEVAALYSGTERMQAPDASWRSSKEWQERQATLFLDQVKRYDSCVIDSRKTTCQRDLSVSLPFKDARLQDAPDFMCGWSIFLHCSNDGKSRYLVLRWVREGGHWRLWGRN